MRLTEAGNLPPPPHPPSQSPGTHTPRAPGASQPHRAQELYLRSVSPSPGLTSALQRRHILRACLFTGLRLLCSCSELGGCKSGLVWKLQSGVTVQSEPNLPGHRATLKQLYSMHPPWGKSSGGCADLLLQSLLPWLPAPHHHHSPRAVLHSHPQLILLFSASAGISFSQRWHGLALAAASPSGASHLSTLGVMHGYRWSHAPISEALGLSLLWEKLK